MDSGHDCGITPQLDKRSDDLGLAARHSCQEAAFSKRPDVDLVALQQLSHALS